MVPAGELANLLVELVGEGLRPLSEFGRDEGCEQAAELVGVAVLLIAGGLIDECDEAELDKALEQQSAFVSTPARRARSMSRQTSVSTVAA